MCSRRFSPNLLRSALVFSLRISSNTYCAERGCWLRGPLNWAWAAGPPPPGSLAPGQSWYGIDGDMTQWEVCLVQRRKAVNSGRRHLLPDRGSPGLGRLQHHRDGRVRFVEGGVCVILGHRWSWAENRESVHRGSSAQALSLTHWGEILDHPWLCSIHSSFIHSH